MHPNCQIVLLLPQETQVEQPIRGTARPMSYKKALDLLGISDRVMEGERMTFLSEADYISTPYSNDQTHKGYVGSHGLVLGDTARNVPGPAPHDRAALAPIEVIGW